MRDCSLYLKSILVGDRIEVLGKTSLRREERGRTVHTAMQKNGNDGLLQ